MQKFPGFGLVFAFRIGVCLSLSVLVVGVTSVALAEEDRQIEQQVRDLFEADARVRDAALQVQSQNGRVTLRGEVGEALDRFLAERIAKRASGVVAVINLVQVAPITRRDKEIRKDLERVLARFRSAPFDTSERNADRSAAADRAAKSSPRTGVQFDVAHGTVTLHGVVETRNEAKRAEQLAAAVRGVRLVRNNLDVPAGSSRQDADVQREIEREIRQHPSLDELPIQVKVAAGVVTLTGIVHHLHQSDYAASLAGDVRGIEAVVNQLIVERKDLLAEATGPPRDVDVQAFVVEELEADPRLTVEDVSVSVEEGRITIRGLVPCLYQTKLAERIAKSVAGDKQVTNHLEIRAGENDEALRSSLQAAFQAEETVPLRSVQIKVDQGEVTLTGEVPCWRTKFTAGRIASQTIGVAGLRNELQVASPHRADDIEILEEVADE